MGHVWIITVRTLRVDSRESRDLCWNNLKDYGKIRTNKQIIESSAIIYACSDW